MGVIIEDLEPIKFKYNLTIIEKIFLVFIYSGPELFAHLLITLRAKTSREKLKKAISIIIWAILILWIFLIFFNIFTLNFTFSIVLFLLAYIFSSLIEIPYISFNDFEENLFSKDFSKYVKISASIGFLYWSLIFILLIITGILPIDLITQIPQNYLDFQFWVILFNKSIHLFGLLFFFTILFHYYLEIITFKQKECYKYFRETQKNLPTLLNIGKNNLIYNRISWYAFLLIPTGFELKLERWHTSIEFQDFFEGFEGKSSQKKSFFLLIFFVVTVIINIGPLIVINPPLIDLTNVEPNNIISFVIIAFVFFYNVIPEYFRGKRWKENIDSIIRRIVAKVDDSSLDASHKQELINYKAKLEKLEYESGLRKLIKDFIKKLLPIG